MSCFPYLFIYLFELTSFWFFFLWVSFCGPTQCPEWVLVTLTLLSWGHKAVSPSQTWQPKRSTHLPTASTYLEIFHSLGETVWFVDGSRTFSFNVPFGINHDFLKNNFLNSESGFEIFLCVCSFLCEIKSFRPWLDVMTFLMYKCSCPHQNGQLSYKNETFLKPLLLHIKYLHWFYCL